MNTDYPIEALEILLNRNCLTERYSPLIPYKQDLIEGLKRLGCKTKEDAARLSEDDYRQLGLADTQLIRLLYRFFTLYDPKPEKLAEIPKISKDAREQAAFRELYCLPGVKRVRASLYDRAGYRSLRELAAASPEEVLARAAAVIEREGLPCAVPLPKEVRTQVAVARAFTW